MRLRLSPFWGKIGSVAALLLLVPDWAGESRLPLLGRVPRFAATPVALYPHDPARRRIGALVFERGYRLTSSDPAFGGFSSLLVDGDRFTLLSDGGNIVRFRLDAEGRLSERRFAEVPDGPGSGWSKADRDTESMVRDAASGRIWVGFERANAIWRFDGDFRAAERHAAPPAMRSWPENGGPEAMLRRADGSFIVLSEKKEGPGGRGRIGLVFARDPTVAPRRGYRFVYLPPPGYSPSDMAVLPDGRLLVLNRRFDLPRLFDVVVTLVESRDIRPGAVVPSLPIAHFAAPALHDNYEGIAVVRDAKGIALWIVSDDNLSIAQQSLLLKFRIDLRAVDQLAARARVARLRPPAPASSARRASGGAP